MNNSELPSSPLTPSPNRTISLPIQRTPIIAERYNIREPPLTTRREKLIITPRFRSKPAPRLVKTWDRSGPGSRSVMNYPHARIISYIPEAPKLSRLYNPFTDETYFEQVYERFTELGQGSFGRVYKVRSREDNKLYAVKCAQTPYKSIRNRREKLSEVETHERLEKHPNILEFISAWEEKDYLYIKTELCDMSLDQYSFENAVLPEWRVWDILLDLAKAIYHLDSHNLLHADIKPENVMIGYDGLCKLGDFGLVADISSGVVEGDHFEGDSRFLAREVLDSGITRAAAMFSLGISILQIATDLNLPNSGERWQELRDLKIDPQFTKDLSPELVKLIFSLMDPIPEERPSVTSLLFSPTLREHEKCRDWNRIWYPVHRNANRFYNLVAEKTSNMVDWFKAQPSHAYNRLFMPKKTAPFYDTSDDDIEINDELIRSFEKSG